MLGFSPVLSIHGRFILVVVASIVHVHNAICNQEGISGVGWRRVEQKERRTTQKDTERLGRAPLALLVAWSKRMGIAIGRVGLGVGLGGEPGLPYHALALVDAPSTLPSQAHFSSCSA